jgi:hypothetical protein
MCTEDSRKDIYNKFTNLPNLSYNCLSYLIEQDESIWKLLKYNDPDAWNKPDLTKEEKGLLIYDGSPNETDFRVFLDVGQDNSWNIQATVLRVSPIQLYPTNHIYGNVSIAFEVYSHFRLNHLSNYTTRIDTIVQKIIEVFNGSEIGGLGRLYFDARANNRSKMIDIGKIPYKGKVVVMCNWIAS